MALLSPSEGGQCVEDVTLVPHPREGVPVVLIQHAGALVPQYGGDVGIGHAGRYEVDRQFMAIRIGFYLADPLGGMPASSATSLSR